MKNKLVRSLILIAVVAMSISFAACGGKPVPVKYQGSWVGEDGSTLYMDAGGKAGFVIGGKKVTGGGAVIDETAKTLTISLAFVTNTWKIDQEPNEKNEMKLDGKIFRRK